jgi:hypothetical protein
MCMRTGSKAGWSINRSNNCVSNRHQTAQDADPGDTAIAMAELCRDYYVDRIVPRAAFLSARALLVRRADELSRRSGRDRR